MPTDLRLQQLREWIQAIKPHATIEPASVDASFRRYFRVKDGVYSWIAMDAPPEKESLTPFIDVTERLLKASVHVPEVFQCSTEQGFLLLTDLGRTPYLAKLCSESANSLYQDAFKALLNLQEADTQGLPVYDSDFLLQEMELMPEWFLSKHLDIQLTSLEQESLESAYQMLADAIRQQPQVFVHRDYHSRNLMITEVNNPGVIDYQDALLGPVCYDLVSLLRDCYICWPNECVEAWCNQFRVMLIERGTIPETNAQTFQRWVDWTGLQRHIKVLGIFARLHHRDGKAHYLEDLPLTLSYVLSIAKKYPEMSAIIEIFNKYDIPARIGTVEIPK